MNQVINIENADYVDEYKIHFKFNDGKENIVNFKPFLFSSSHPDVKKYQNEKLFKKFTLNYGEIEWNDYELAFPIFDIYQGHI